MREKLNELLNNIQQSGVIYTPSQMDDRYGTTKAISNAEIVDHLIANGVIIPVRCKDCKYRHDSCFAGNGNTYCDFHHKYFPLDGFCTYGERKDNET